MSGFENDVVFALNADFTQADNQAPVEANGLVTDGQIWVGSTATNAGGTHINVGSITSPDSSITVGYSSPNITLQVAGGGAITSVTATNASVDFIQTGTIENINFGNTNLVLGSDVTALTSGNNNVGLGLSVLSNVTSGEQNVAVGTQSLQLLTTGSANTSVGRNSQASLNNGLSNTSTGQNSLFSNYSGSNNTAYGAGALQSYQGSNNTAVGYLACRDTTGTGNLGNGFISLVNCSTGTNNTAIGNGSLQLITTGSSNIALGFNAGSALTLNDSNEILIGTNQNAVAGESNTTRIGVTQTRAFIAGIAGVATSNSQMVTIDSTTGQLGSTVMALQTSQVTLTSSQIKNLNGTPIVLIAAQGAGTVINIVSAIAKFNYGGSNVFVAAASQNINMYYGTTVAATNGFITNAQIIGSADTYQASFTPPTSLSNIAVASLENVAINAYNTSATEISGNAANDNTITILIKYYVSSI